MMAKTASVTVRVDESALRERMRDLLADAWDEGHRTRRLPDDTRPCLCSAWSESECGCGNYGRTTDAPNPYRSGGLR